MESTLNAIRSFLLHHVLAGTDTVVRFQKLFGVHTDFSSLKSTSSHATESSPPAPVIRSTFFYFLFMTAAAAGNELFYIIALPALFWLVNIDLARRLLVVWGLVYYVGQSAKDLLKLPRPPSPPVTQLEQHYQMEYGFPSTHAMISFVLPFYTLFVLDVLDHEFSWPFGLFLATLWCASITLSRLFVGVHSVCDLVGGLFLGLFVLLIGLWIGEPVDAFIIAHPLAPLIAIAVSMFCIWSYPAPHVWTNAYGDTALIIAVVAGISCGQSVYFNRHPSIALHVTGVDFLSRLQSFCGCGVEVLVRLAVGCTVLFLTRSLMKKISHLIWLPIILPKYVAYCSLLPSPIASTESSTSSPNAAISRSLTPSLEVSGHQPNLKRTRSEGSHMNVTNGAATPPTSEPETEKTNSLRQREKPHSSTLSSNGAAAIPSALPTRPIQPAPPQQFRLRVDTIRTTGSASPSPLGALLSKPHPTARHKVVKDPHDPKTTLVEFDFDGQTVVINPLHVYLVEIPIKYFTYFAVGFNATCTVPFIFHLLGI